MVRKYLLTLSLAANGHVYYPILERVEVVRETEHNFWTSDRPGYRHKNNRCILFDDFNEAKAQYVQYCQVRARHLTEVAKKATDTLLHATGLKPEDFNE